MSLQNLLQQDSQAARIAVGKAENETDKCLAQQKSALLSTLYAEVAMKGKNACNGPATDEQAIAIVKKFVEGAKTVAQAFASRGEPAKEASALQEVAWLEQYLPKTLSEAETQEAINKLKAQGISGVGPLMGALRKEYGALLDNALASKLAKG